jgi:hypothetical protein
MSYINTYYSDVDKKWPNYTNDDGQKLLNNLKVIVRKIHKKMEIKNQDLEIGKNVYTNKTNNKLNGETWSIEEYMMPPFRAFYYQMKSVQRYTEMYSLLEKVRPQNLFTIRDVFLSIGCGPAFEMQAFRDFAFFNLHGADIIDEWKEAASSMVKFYNNDFEESIKLIKILKASVIVLSYVFVSYLQGQNYTEKLFKECPSIRTIIINDRKSHIPEFEGMKNIYRVNDWNDDRQVLIFRDDSWPIISPNIQLTFPNVPYAENIKYPPARIYHMHFSAAVKMQKILNYIGNNKNKFTIARNVKDNWGKFPFLIKFRRGEKDKAATDKDINDIRMFVMNMNYNSVHDISMVAGITYHIMHDLRFLKIYCQLLCSEFENFTKVDLRYRFSGNEKEIALIGRELPANKFNFILQENRNQPIMTIKSKIERAYRTCRKYVNVLGYDFTGEENSRGVGKTGGFGSISTLKIEMMAHAGEGWNKDHIYNYLNAPVKTRIGHGIAAIKVDTPRKELIHELTPIGYELTKILTRPQIRELLEWFSKSSLDFSIDADDTNRYGDRDFSENLKYVQMLAGFTTKQIKNLANFKHV